MFDDEGRHLRWPTWQEIFMIIGVLTIIFGGMLLNYGYRLVPPA